MISHKHKFIFAHIPKTGGTAISTALRKFGLKGEGHRTITSIHSAFKMTPQQVQQYFCFAVVRNPWDIVVSNYFYVRMKKNYWHSNDGTTKYGPHPDHKAVSKMSFGQFVRAIQENKLKSRYFRTQQSYWLDGKIDFIAKFERLQDDFDIICDKIGIAKQKLPIINASKHSNYSQYYNHNLQRIVADIYNKDIKRFGYKL
jgi:chondroitin 4-sulfotransferase 11